MLSVDLLLGPVDDGEYAQANVQQLSPVLQQAGGVPHIHEPGQQT